MTVPLPALRSLLLVVVCWWVALAHADTIATTYKDYYKEYAADTMRVSTTRYNWQPLAAQITEGCTSNYEKLRAIYEWTCSHIDYDMSFGIFTADSCMIAHRGVCQAYCEVFYRLASAVGVRVEIIGGSSKDINGHISGAGHSWLFGYTQPNRGIFLDPTWGAGSVVNGVYVHNNDCWQWFNVDPEWLILSHFPDHSYFQLIDRPVTLDEFRLLPTPNPLWPVYGLDIHAIYSACRADSLSLPIFYNGAEGELRLLDIPWRQSLRIGEYYTFRISMSSSREFALKNGDVLCKRDEWTDEGNGVWSVRFMPRATDPLYFGLKDPKQPDYWNYMAEYAIEVPTPADWARVEQQYPLCLPEARAVKNLQPEAWQQAGIDGHRLLQIIREERPQELPILYSDKGQRLTIVSVPMNRRLQRGQSYTFSFRPQSGVNWAILNGTTWYRDWQQKDGLYTMTVTPRTPGTLALYVQLDGTNSFWTCLEYLVE